MLNLNVVQPFLLLNPSEFGRCLLCPIQEKFGMTLLDFLQFVAAAPLVQR